MTHRRKEHILQNIMAFSFFVLALGLLPVTNSLIHKGQPEAQTGQVAGVSTDRSLSDQDSCIQDQQSQLVTLQATYDQQNVTSLNQFDQMTQEYTEAKQQLQGAPESIVAETQALDGLIADQEQAYHQALLAAERDFESQKATLESVSCPLE